MYLGMEIKLYYSYFCDLAKVNVFYILIYLVNTWV